MKKKDARRLGFNRIHYVMIERGITDLQLAIVCDHKGTRTSENWRRGKGRPRNFSTIKKIEDFFGMKLETLFTFQRQ